MNEIKAFIRPTKAKTVYKALRAAGFCCMTLTESEGTGLYTDPREDFPTFKFPLMHSKVVRIEIVCLDTDMEAIVHIIQNNGRTGHPEDGIIYTQEVRQVYRVKNDQTGVDAV